MSIRIILDTAALKLLLADKPELEVELSKVAVEKVSEEYRRKIDAALPSMHKALNAATERLVQQASHEISRYGDASPLKQLVSRLVAQELGGLVREVVRDEVHRLAVEDLGKNTAFKERVDQLAERTASALMNRVLMRVEVEAITLLKQAAGIGAVKESN